MASELITLGIGAPSSIQHFILFGLSVNDVVVEPVADVTVIVRARVRTIVVRPDVDTVTIQARPRTVIVR